MHWRQKEVPNKQTRTGLWDELIPGDLIREMRNNPATTFVLTDERGEPAPVSRPDYSALQRSVPRPYRVQGRTTKPGVPSAPVHVYVSMDPGHWERVAKMRAERTAK